ncbi:NAD(P)/FAD-dependent oxidoreductase [Vibrio marisflavi]|uniref:Amine oxidase domain-containing protein n=1 Tax=Vibrio marisflavi CECT 7928 TaxID=634439 RepID=A0ABM9A6L6_9VIBR|nr:FAD-dependent oxidoreductase [Vibrio marisflavi]CAH0540598.1 hypothetical protein VMF7928_02975 [Vibrio marisflavi CECT 7928]
MNIAIIGTGISGLTCGYHLAREHNVTLFEANDYIGGHTATVDVQLDDHIYAVDTGFIVFNDRTYPNFITMLEEIGVQGNPTEMSFSVNNQRIGLEYNGHTLATLFAQKRNLFSPKFYRFIAEILRFNKLAKVHHAQNSGDETYTLGDFLQAHAFSEYFCENYILPMGAAIWSSSMADIRSLPVTFFFRFFLNHGLLDIVNRPQWYVIPGGSRSYIEPLTRDFKDEIRLNCPVYSVKRDAAGVTIESSKGAERYDYVIFACHSDQALALLNDRTEPEREVLQSMAYRANDVVLHTDTTLLPNAKSAWASWNYLIDEKTESGQLLPSVTYNMNILQGIQSNHTFCVSLNSTERINPIKVIRSFVYHHPVFTTQSIQARARKDEINGENRTWFCGAYWYNGFHEDGVKSALDVVRGINFQCQDKRKAV